MAQPSVACFFNSRKRTAVDDAKISQVSKDSVSAEDECPNGKLKKLQDKEETIGLSKIINVPNAIVPAQKKTIKATRKKLKPTANNRNIQELINNMKNQETVIESEQKSGEDTHRTPPASPVKQTINAMDKVRPDGPSIKDIRNKMSRSKRLADLKASIARFQEADRKLTEIEKETVGIPESPKLKGFKTIELQVMTSPQKVFSPEKAYLSPRKEGSGVRRNLLNLMSPTKNAIATSTASPSKELLSETTKPALTLPFKYRFLAEMFRAIDTVIQILYNRKETITFKKLKPAVEEILKRNLLEKHLSQIKTVYPDAFSFAQEKLKVFGSGMRAEQWELVVHPVVNNDGNMTSDVLLQRRRKLFKVLLDKVKEYHHEFLMSLDTPINIPKDKVTRWHPEFDIEKVPDIEFSPLPQPPAEDKLTSGKDVLERARVLFSCNTKMELALQKLKDSRKNEETPISTQESSQEMPQSILKGIPKSLLEKVRQKQAAKALISMTRSSDKEKEVQLYSRLPEIARLTRNVFVAEKKGVLTLDTLVDKLGNSYRGNLTKAEMEEHLKVIAKELPSWLVFHEIRHCVYVKLRKNADLSLVLNKLENLCKQKNET